MPKVSIIIPVYNVEQYIERCVRSLFEQTLDDIEYIFVDDCSPDNSITVLHNVLQEYPHRKDYVIIHRMDVNGGQAKAREWGILNATGEYTIHCDPDDSVTNTAYEELYTKAKELNSDIIFHDYFYCNNQLVQYKTLGINGKSRQQVISGVLQGKIKASLCMSFIKKDLFNDARFSFPKGDMTEDSTIILQLLAFTDRISYIEKGLYYYYQNSESITNIISKNSCIKRYESCVVNTALLESFFVKTSIHLSEEFDLRKLDAINQLLPCVYMNKYLKVWKGTYPQLPKRLLHSKLLSIGDKIKVIITYIGLYPLYQFIKGYKFAR